MKPQTLHVVLAIAGITAILGVAMVPWAAPGQPQDQHLTPTTPQQPTQTTAETTTITGPSLTVDCQATDRLDFGDSTRIIVSVKHENGDPASDVPVTISSLGYGGKFDPDRNVTTDADGTGTVEWVFVRPGLEEEMHIRSLGGWPPAEQTAFYATATVDGERVEGVATVPLNMTCQTCHKAWRHSPPRTTNASE